MLEWQKIIICFYYDLNVFTIQTVFIEHTIAGIVITAWIDFCQFFLLQFSPSNTFAIAQAPVQFKGPQKEIRYLSVISVLAEPELYPN